MQVVATLSYAGRGRRIALAVVATALATAGCARDPLADAAPSGYSLKDGPNVVRNSPARAVVERTSFATRRADAAPAQRRAAAAAGLASTPSVARTEPAPAALLAVAAPAHSGDAGSGTTRAGASGAVLELPSRRPGERADGRHCMADAACQARVAELASDQAAGWLVGTPALADDLSGARFHALRVLKSKLSCDRLELARGTVTGSQERLALVVRRAPEGDENVTAARGAMKLAVAILAELAHEHERRCR
ncbi:MAG: hypothetical protein R3D27_06640 [Hyphomicrobiaceae bacterium]